MIALQTILSIAGSDPSGGAGLQADLKTLAILGCYGAAIPTNITVQNTQGVSASQAIDAELVRAQIECVLSDLDVSHIKIGMIGNLEIAEAIAASIKNFTGEVILDPVLKASDGSNLSTSLAPINTVARQATVLTPNFDELCQLSATVPDSVTATIEASQTAFDSFPKLRCIICKGGHLQENLETVTDHIHIKTPTGAIEHYSQSHPRVTSPNTHGTGCTYASAFACYHQKSADDLLAFKSASQFVHQLLTSSQPYQTGKGNGGLLHHLYRPTSS